MNLRFAPPPVMPIKKLTFDWTLLKENEEKEEHGVITRLNSHCIVCMHVAGWIDFAAVVACLSSKHRRGGRRQEEEESRIYQ